MESLIKPFDWKGFITIYSQLPVCKQIFLVTANEPHPPCVSGRVNAKDALPLNGSRFAGRQFGLATLAV